MKIFTSIVLAFVALVSSPTTTTLVDARTASAIVDILAYNDVYEMLQDSVNGFNIGGPSRVVPIAKAMRAANPNSLVLFAGDTMSPSLWSTQLKGMQMVEAHNAIGTDYGCLGNHEFDFGVEGFLNVSAATKFTWLNANCYEIETGSLLRNTVPRAIKTFNDPVFGKISIGLFGVMYNLNDPNKGCYWEDPITSAQKQVAALQKKGVDMIIALTHQDLADDNVFSQKVTGVDMIYAGHDHTSMLQTNFGAPYVKADFDFRSIWRTHIEHFPAEGTYTKTNRMTHTAIPITEDMETDADLDAVIDGLSKQIAELTSAIIGTSCEDLDLTNKVVRAMDCPIGSIFAEAQLAFYGEGSIDITVMNGGGIRTDKVYPAGSLTVGQVIGWSPFGNTLMSTKTNGASLKKYLTKEMLTSCGAGFINLNGQYVHPGGMKYTFKCTGTGAGSVTSMEWFNHPTHTGPILDTDEFVLGLSNYLYNYEFITIPDIVSEVVVSEAEAGRIDTALEQYISKLPDAKLCFKAEGRSLVSF